MIRITPRRFHAERQVLLLIFTALLLLATSCTINVDENGPLPTLVPSLPKSTDHLYVTEATVQATPTAALAPEPTVAATWTAVPTSPPTAKPTPSPAPACQEAGRIVHQRFSSVLASSELAYRIYLPPCYGQDSRVYPVLYMLPGNIHGAEIWDQLGLDEAAEVGIQNGDLPPMLIVMTEGGVIANQTSGGPYSFEGVILDELRPHVEAAFCAWQDPAGRAIGGLSRGGYWSLEIAFRNPTQFASVGAHAAALVDTYAGPALDPKFTALTSDLSTIRIYLDAGQNDWYLPQFRILHENLLSVGKEHEWLIQEGSHDNKYWAAHVADYLRWYAQPWSFDRANLPQCSLPPE